MTTSIRLPDGTWRTPHFSAPQLRATKALRQDRTVVLNWYRGTGLSWFTRTTWYRMVAAQPAGDRGVRILHVVPDLTAWTDGERALFEEELATTWRALGGRFDRIRSEVRFSCGSWVRVMSERSLSTATRGMRADVVTTANAEDLGADVRRTVQPLMSEPWSLRMMMVCGKHDPDKARSLLAAAMTWPGAEVIRATYKDCPEIVDGAHVERIRAETDPRWFAREFSGTFDPQPEGA